MATRRLVRLVGTVGNALFDQRDDPRSLTRMTMLDGLNARAGRGAVCFGRTHVHRPWLLRNDMLSQR